MFRRIALASAIALSSLGFATAAHAKSSETISFTAEVDFECEFRNTEDGMLDYGGFPSTVLSFKLGNGQASSTDRLCNGDKDLLKEAKQKSEPVLPSPVEYTVAVDPDGVEDGENTKLTVDLAARWSNQRLSYTWGRASIENPYIVANTYLPDRLLEVNNNGKSLNQVTKTFTSF